MAFDTPGVDTPQLVQVNLTNILRQAERREEAGLLRIQVLAEPDTEEQPLRAKLILGLIRTLIDFEGTLDAAWTSVALGVLLLVFVGLQHRVSARFARGTT